LFHRHVNRRTGVEIPTSSPRALNIRYSNVKELEGT
jgi:hypothetical protein